MIIQTAPRDTQRLAIMMYEHTALCLQFAHAFGNDRFETLSSRPEESHPRALPKPCVNLSIHTAPDVRPFP